MAVLSKSKILAYIQCPKRLWLEVHQPESRTDTSATAASFAAGHAVGETSRRIYDPDGSGIFLDIKALGLKGLIAATQNALTKRKTIFEAGFVANGTLSLADILIPVEDVSGPAWRMVEVKSVPKDIIFSIANNPTRRPSSTIPSSAPAATGNPSRPGFPVSRE